VLKAMAMLASFTEGGSMTEAEAEALTLMKQALALLVRSRSASFADCYLQMAIDVLTGVALLQGHEDKAHDRITTFLGY